MRVVIFTAFIFSMVLIFSSCESLQDGPLAVKNEEGNMLKPLPTGKQVRVCKAVCEGCNVKEVCWTDKDFNLPDFETQPFTITSVELCLVSSSETANLCAGLFGESYTEAAGDCQLPTTFRWEGEYPEEHPFYDGFSIGVNSDEILADVEAVCSITYVVH